MSKYDLQAIQEAQDMLCREIAQSTAAYQGSFVLEQPICEAAKFDQGKLPWDLLPSDALEEVLKVLRFGANKYAPRNWEKGTEWSRFFAAAQRHLWAWHRGNDVDEETGLSHMAHAACCVLFLLAYEAREIGTDDRPKGMYE